MTIRTKQGWYQRVWALLSFIEEQGKDLYPLAPLSPERKTQFKRRHQSRKAKKDKPNRPPEFYAAELIVDLELAFYRKDLKAAIALYFAIIRLLDLGGEPDPLPIPPEVIEKMGLLDPEERKRVFGGIEAW